MRKMKNIVPETMKQIEDALADSDVTMDSWRSDAIQKILVIAFNRAFQEGRLAGLKDVLALFKVPTITENNLKAAVKK